MTYGRVVGVKSELELAREDSSLRVVKSREQGTLRLYLVGPAEGVDLLVLDAAIRVEEALHALISEVRVIIVELVLPVSPT